MDKIPVFDGLGTLVGYFIPAESALGPFAIVLVAVLALIVFTIGIPWLGIYGMKKAREEMQTGNPEVGLGRFIVSLLLTIGGFFVYAVVIWCMIF